MADIEALWRCVTCRKWSHAKRRPKRHQRWVREGDEAYDPELDEATPLDEGDVGHAVECGPFEKWRARRVLEGPLDG